MTSLAERPLLSPSSICRIASDPSDPDDRGDLGGEDPLEVPAFHVSQGDAVSWMGRLADGSIDLLITDPAYESLEKHRAIGTTTRLTHSKASSNDWFSIFPNARFSELFAEAYRVLARNAHFYLFCDQETMFVAKPLAEAAGFKFWKPLIWDKCLGPDTLVWAERGRVRIADICEGDRVARSDGGWTTVVATRRTRARACRITLSDGERIVASLEHRFVLRDGAQIEVQDLRVGDVLRTSFRGVVRDVVEVLDIEDIGMQDLVDISVLDPSQLFLLANGVVTHNCKIGMGYHYRARYECILFLEKGKRKLADLGIPDVIEVPRVADGYPTEKPVAVSEVLIRQSSRPGEAVADPFMGSGSVGVAALRLGRGFLGNDLAQSAIDVALPRLAEVGRQVGVLGGEGPIPIADLRGADPASGRG